MNSQKELKNEFKEFLKTIIEEDPLLPNRIERTIKKISYIHEDKNKMIYIMWKE